MTDRIAELADAMARAAQTGETDTEIETTDRRNKLTKALYATISAFTSLYPKLTNEDTLLCITALLATSVASITQKENQHRLQHIMHAVLLGADVSEKLGEGVVKAVEVIHEGKTH